jgi:predicted transcriptional regulator
MTRLNDSVMHRISTLVDRGWTRKRIAEELNYHPCSISRYLRQWREQNQNAPELTVPDKSLFTDRNAMFLAARKFDGTLEEFLTAHNIGIKSRTFRDWAKPWAAERGEPAWFDRPRWHGMFEGREEDFERFKRDWGVK